MGSVSNTSHLEEAVIFVSELYANADVILLQCSSSSQMYGDVLGCLFWDKVSSNYLCSVATLGVTCLSRSASSQFINSLLLITIRHH